MPAQRGYPLPDPVDNGERLCVVVRVPNIPAHRQAFIGAVAELTHAYNWGDDSAHTALEIAYLWKNVWDEMMEHFYDNDCGENMVKCCVVDITIHIIHRVNPDTGRLEVSNDDGTTWYPDPDDPVHMIPSLPPPVPAGVSATKCDAATNGAQHIYDLIAGTKANLDNAISVFDLGVAIAGLALEIALVIFSGGAAAWALTPQILALVGLIWGAARALFSMGAEAFDTYWDSDERDKILCALYCTIGDNGAFTDAQFEAFMTRWKVVGTPSPALDMMTGTIRGIGAKGLSQYAAYGNAADSDCSSCNCGCDITHWEIQIGTLIERDDTHITLQCVEFGGSWIAAINAPTIVSCCNFALPVATGEGSPVATWGIVPEEFQVDPRDYPHTGIWGTGKDVNAISVFGFSGGVLDTVTFTVNGECES